ncbi:MAG: hypothetical protein RR205_05755, partial [Oscillospiraceae bacterium]
ITSPRHMVFYTQQETQNNQLTPFSPPSLFSLNSLSHIPTVLLPEATLPAGGTDKKQNVRKGVFFMPKNRNVCEIYPCFFGHAVLI